MRRKIIDSMVAHGVRAQIKTGSLLTGAVFIAFEVFPGAHPAYVDWSQNPPQLPTTPGQLAAVEASVGNIIKKLDKMPLQQIGDNLNQSLANLDLTLVSARGTLHTANTTLNSASTALNHASTALNNANGLVEPNSAQIEEVDQTLQEVSRAARSLRVLADYLEQHPEALIRGKRGEAQ